MGGIGRQLVVSTDAPNFGALATSGSQCDFGQTQVGSTNSLELVITNSGTVPFNQLVFSRFGQDSDQFQVVPSNIGPVAPGAVVSVTLKFMPRHVGTSWSRVTLEGQGSFYVKKVLRLQGDGDVPANYTPARATFLVQDFATGTPISQARLGLGQIVSAITDSDGYSSLQVPQAIPCRVGVSKAGCLTRYAFVEVFNPGGGADLPITLINENQPQFSLGAFKRLLFDAQSIGPYVSRRWMEPPDVYVDMRPDPITGDAFSPAEIEHLLTNAPPILRQLSGGFVQNPALRSGTNPPLSGAIVYELNSGMGFDGGTTGGGNVHAELRTQVISLSSRSMAANRGVVTHETGHAIGFGHTSGADSVMTGNSIFWPLQMPLSFPDAPTDFDRLMGRILYSRPPGMTTTEDISDPTELDSVFWPISDVFDVTDTSLR